MSNDPSKSSESNRNQSKSSESNSQRSPRDSQSAIPLPDRLREIWKTAQPILRTQSIRAFHGLSRAIRWSLQKLEATSPSVEPAASNSHPQNGATHEAANGSDKQAIANHSQSDRQSSPTVSGSSAPKADNPLQAIQNVWRRVLPMLRVQGVRVLRVLADASDWAVHRLSPSADTSAMGSQNTPQSQTWAVLDQSVAKLQQAWIGWSGWLNRLRDRLPESWRTVFSPPIVTSTLVILLVVLFSGISSSSSAQAPERVQPSLIQEDRTPADETAAMETPDSSMPSSDRLGEQSETRAAEPSPPLKLTPEQSLIAAIQDEVAEITSQYTDGLIQSMQANFRSSRLTVNMGSDWYKLSHSRQDQLANEMLERANELEFKALELLDPQGNVLARSPVIGSTMIVLHRSHISDST
ncbi:MAG: hypothetical protein ACFE0I_17245 [Elainellaceae cyanobacterium]